MGELTQNRSVSPDPLDAARYRSATLALRGCRRWCAPCRRLQRLPLPCAGEKIKLALWSIGYCLRLAVTPNNGHCGAKRASARERLGMRYLCLVALLACGTEQQLYSVPCDQQLTQCVKTDSECSTEHELCVQRVEAACVASQAACFAQAGDAVGSRQIEALGACYAAVAACVTLGVTGAGPSGGG